MKIKIFFPCTDQNQFCSFLEYKRKYLTNYNFKFFVAIDLWYLRKVSADFQIKNPCDFWKHKFCCACAVPVSVHCQIYRFLELYSYCSFFKFWFLQTFLAYQHQCEISSSTCLQYTCMAMKRLNLKVGIGKMDVWSRDWGEGSEKNRVDNRKWEEGGI